MDRRDFLKTMGMGAAALALLDCRPRVTTAARPNMIFIMTDDHAAHALGSYGSRINQTPHLDRIGEEGMRFDNCFCTNSICAPSRAVILTGLYSHLNGVRDNTVAFDGSQDTFPKMLRAAGYHTAMIGKWHLKSEPTGFDYWNVLPGQGQYYNPDLIEMGEKTRREGYVTDLLTGIALDYMNTRSDSKQPFMMMLHHKAPHRNWQPAPRHLSLYDETDFPEPETLFDDYSTRGDAARQQEQSVREDLIPDYDLKMGEAPERLNVEQRRAWEAAYGPKREAYEQEKPTGDALVRWKYKRYMEDYLGCIAAVDESVGRILEDLERTGLTDNTLVIYTSDQGFYLGDHGWFDKRFMYEESLRMPLLARFPGRIPAGSSCRRLVSNLDFAPTFLDWAGISPPESMQGASLRRIMSDLPEKSWRSSIYYHYYEYPAVHMVKRHYGVRTSRYKLMHFYHDIDAWELYDLEKDPHELNNVFGDPDYEGVRSELEMELERLRGMYGDSSELDLRFIEEDRLRAEKRKR